jgi:hypothetical protein
MHPRKDSFFNPIQCGIIGDSETLRRDNSFFPAGHPLEKACLNKSNEMCENPKCCVHLCELHQSSHLEVAGCDGYENILKIRKNPKAFYFQTGSRQGESNRRKAYKQALDDESYKEASDDESFIEQVSA